MIGFYVLTGFDIFCCFVLITLAITLLVIKRTTSKVLVSSLMLMSFSFDEVDKFF